jgi:hypothetical protein
LSIGLDVIGTVASDAAASKPSEVIHRDQLRFIFMLPVDLMAKTFSIVPTMHIRTNVYRTADLENGNASITGGIDIGAKPIKQVSAKAGFAVGGYRNDCLEETAGYVATAPLGMLINAGVGVSPGFGKATVDFSFGNWKDREADAKLATEVVDVKSNSQLYWDIMYDAPIASLVIRPRLRIWKTINDMDDSGRLWLRPEIDFIAKF